MPKGGHNRKPTDLHRAQGTARPDRHAEPVGEIREVPSPPEGLSAEATVVWDREVPFMLRSGMLTGGDRYLLGRWCEAWAQILDANASIDQHGYIYQEPDGYGEVKLKANPAVLRRERAFELIAKLETEIGFLSPAQRARAGNARAGQPKPGADADAPKPRKPRKASG